MREMLGRSVLALAGEEIAASLLGLEREWEAEKRQRETHVWMVGRLNAFHRSRRTSTGYQLKRALRSKRYQPNGRRECERRSGQIITGKLKYDNGFVPSLPDWLREAA